MATGKGVNALQPKDVHCGNVVAKETVSNASIQELLDTLEAEINALSEVIDYLDKKTIPVRNAVPATSGEDPKEVSCSAIAYNIRSKTHRLYNIRRYLNQVIAEIEL